MGLLMVFGIHPEQICFYLLALKNGVQVHTHTNGDQAIQLSIETLEAALRQAPSLDHRLHFSTANLPVRRNFVKCSAWNVRHRCKPSLLLGDEHYSRTVDPKRQKV